MKHIHLGFDFIQWTERDVQIALASIWESKYRPANNYSIVLGSIFHSGDTETFNIAFWNAMCKASDAARKRASGNANEKAWKAQERKAAQVAKNLMWCMEQDFFSNEWCSEDIAKQLCKKSIVGLSLENGKFADCQENEQE